MKNLKRRLAGLLAAVLLVSTLPTTALAAEPATAPPPALEDQTDIQTAPEGDTAEDPSQPDPEDSLTGEVPSEGDISEEATPMEPDPITVPQDGGVQIGLWVGGEYYPAVPETISTFSLLPLEEKSFTVDLRNVIGSELEEVRLEALLTNPNTPDESGYSKDTTVVWGLRNSADRFNIAEKDTIDLSPYMENGSVSLELIVGSKDQLDPGNIRYIVYVQLTDPKDLLLLKMTAGDSSETKTGSNSTYDWLEDNTRANYYHFYNDISFWDIGEAKLTMTLNGRTGGRLPCGLLHG